MAPEQQRKADLAAIERVLSYELSEDLAERFTDMRACLLANLGTTRRAQVVLSEKQRAFVRDALDRFEPQYENLVSSGRVPLKPTRVFDYERMPRPLKPPQRRSAT